MEKIEYGTTDPNDTSVAVFNVINLISCERTPIYDRARNYLYTHWDFTVEVNWQPSLVAYNPSPFPNPPVATPGNLPGLTDLALLSYILQPRRRLKVTAGGSVVLQVPTLNPGGSAIMPCDVTGGPYVETVSVPRMIGTRHWVVTLRFMADVRDVIFPTDSTNQNAIISNLWVGMEDITEERRALRRYAGRAILRADVMRDAKLNANSFRDLYLFPCPKHYQRKNVHVELSEDGTILDWSFEDEMRGYDLGLGSLIIDIQCFRTGAIGTTGAFEIARDILRSAAQQATMGFGTDIISGGTSLAAWGASAGILGIIDNVPRTVRHCRCDVTGDRNADLGVLSSIAFGVCLNAVGFSLATVTAGTTEIIFRQDLADHVFTSCEMSLRMTDDTALAASAAIGTWNAIAPTRFSVPAGSATTGQLMTQFTTDSRTLNIVPLSGGGPALPVADRSGQIINDNPPLLQGAFPVIVPDVGAGPAPGVSPTPTGSIPTGVEKLIVQALLGWNVAPPPQPSSSAPQS